MPILSWAEPGWRPMAAARAVMCALAGASILAACRTNPATSFPSPTNGKVDLVGLAPGFIVITAPSNAAAISVDPPNRRMDTASEGAADATRSFLNTPNLGNPQLEAGVGVVQFALAPFAAAYGAINASQQRLSAGQMSEAQQDLAAIMRSNAVPETLVQKVGEIARQKTRRLLVCADPSSNAPAKGAPVSAELELAVEYLRLNVEKPGGSKYVLSMGARARMVRALDRKVLWERSYRYESGPGLYIDWARYRGLEGVAETGYEDLARQIAEDVFEPASEPPILIGPGHKRSRVSGNRVSIGASRRGAEVPWPAVAERTEQHRQHAPGKSIRWLLAFDTYRGKTSMPRGNRVQALGRKIDEDDSMANASLQFVSFVQEETGSMEIHTGKTDERLRVPKPGPESGSDSGETSDTQWAMDGLEYDRNAVVQGASCLAAVPMGIWEQSFGLIRKHSKERTDELVRYLRAVTTQEHLEGELADEVARRLQSMVVDSVRRADEPLRFVLSSLTEPSGHQSSHAVTATQSKTAMEIQVISTKLVGKHRNSRSRAVSVEIQATIFRTSDGQELYSCPIHYRSSEKRLKAWAASDSKLFRQELDECLRQTAQTLASDLIARGFATPLQSSNSGIPNPSR